MKKVQRGKIRPTVLIAGPMPPPHSGQEMMTHWLMKSTLSKKFNLIHVDISNKRSNKWRGKLDIRNVTAVMESAFKLLKAIIKEKPLLTNIPMARNTWGFIKFSIYVIICSLSGVIIVSRLGGDNFDVFWKDSSWPIKRYIEFILSKITVIIVRADRLKRQFYGLVPQEKLRTVYIGMGLSKFERTKVPNSKNRSRLSESRNPEHINVLFVGHISKAKGALDVLKTIPLVIRKVSSIKFYFAGDMLKKEYNVIHIDNPPDIEAEVKRIITESNIGKYVEFLGIISGEEKLEIFLNCHIFTLPSYSEGFPFVVLEAAAARLAVVATPVGALPEVFKEEENILFVDPGNIRAIASSIVRLAKDEDLRKRMGESARRVVAEKFNLDVLAEAMEKIFNEALALRYPCLHK